MYALKVKGEGSAAKLAALVHKVREARPNMKITIGETWLMKDGGGAPKVPGYQDIFARNDFSFWSPLDEQFLNLLMGLGQKENISAVVPFFSQYFSVTLLSVMRSPPSCRRGPAAFPTPGIKPWDPRAATNSHQRARR